MKIEITIPNNQIDFLKKISMNNTPQEFIQNYINFNLFGIDIEKDEFYFLEEKLKEYEINQEQLARYFNTSQASISRFIKNKSKRSELYSSIFGCGLSFDELFEKVKKC